jgi:hypothetical protein
MYINKEKLLKIFPGNFLDGIKNMCFSPQELLENLGLINDRK